MTVPSKKPWSDPVKGHPAKDSTMNTKGDFGEFTNLMRRLVTASHSEVTRGLEEEKQVFSHQRHPKDKLIDINRGNN
jgi:hypothetical protein